MTRYITLAEYVWLAEQVTGLEAVVLSKASRIDLADSALHAPGAGFGDQDFYPDLIDVARQREGTTLSPVAWDHLRLRHRRHGDDGDGRPDGQVGRRRRGCGVTVDGLVGVPGEGRWRRR